jgi:CubicO group peptidase (beta-lactamase class C family)
VFSILLNDIRKKEREEPPGKAAAGTIARPTIVYMGVKVSMLFALTALPLAAAEIQTVKPEDVGLSSERLRRIHETMQRHIEAHDISGAVTMVARKGRLAHLEAHGLMDIDTKKAMSKDTLFWIASMTKPVTGVAVLMLMEEGTVRLSDPVSRFIPEFRNMKVAVTQGQTFYTVPAAREITIQDLLSHVSGLVSGGAASTAEEAKLEWKSSMTLADYIPRLSATPLDFQPGSRWSYSGAAGFETLGRIVEIVSGQPLDRFLRQRIFEPLGMNDTSFHVAPEQRARVATLYHRGNNALTKVDTPDWLNGPYLAAAGGLLSDAEDYLQFCLMLADGGQLNGKRLLSPKTVDLMSSIFAPDSLPGRTKGRGFGLSVQVISDAVAARTPISNGSYGWDGAFGTHFWVDPKEKIVGILMIQTDNPIIGLNGDFENAVIQAVVE